VAHPVLRHGANHFGGDVPGLGWHTHRIVSAVGGSQGECIRQASGATPRRWYHSSAPNTQFLATYQVIKKWLSYRERELLGRDLTVEEAR
jgi:hypothetical protein